MVKMYFIDLFCGAGGVTTGIHKARYQGKEIAKVIACVNHDAKAIKSHETNHPEALHYIEDIRVLDLTEMAAMVAKIRAQEPDAIICLWASLECTNFSRAKGGLPRNADSRTLAEHLFRYIEQLNPDMIWIENVVEFMSWGPLDEKGKPVSSRNGADYVRWNNAVQSYGYSMEARELNTADFGGYTSRKRLFIQFAKSGIQIFWPSPTHAKNPAKVVGMFANAKKWKPVKDVLDLEEVGQSIFTRKKPLSPKTHERIFHGLIKFVAGGKEPYANFMLKYLSTGSDGSMKNCTQSIDSPSSTITTQNRHFLASVQFISKYYSGKPEHKNASIDAPCPTIKTVDNNAFVNVDFISNYNGKGTNTSIESPIGSITTVERQSLIRPFIYRDYSNGGSSQSINSPAGSLTTVPKISLLTPQHWIQSRQFQPETHNFSIDTASPALLASKQKEIITAMPWLTNFQFMDKGCSIANPAPTIVGGRRYYYILNPQYGIQNHSIEKPSHTLIANMAKTPPYLVSIEGGNIGIIVNEHDDEFLKLIKEFMAAFGIIDIKMRMLAIKEKLRIHGFPEDYYLEGNQADKNKFIGNSVPPDQVVPMIETSFVANFIDNERKAA